MKPDPAEPNFDEPRKCVGVVAARLDPGQERTLAALERAFPVRFERIDPPKPDLNGVDGLLVFGAAPAENALAENAPTDLPRLMLPSDTQGDGSRVEPNGAYVQHDRAHLNIASGETFPPVVLANESVLARSLRGRTIPEGSGADPVPLSPPGARALASVGGRPVWWQTGDGIAAGPTSLSASAYPLAELGDGEALREHLHAGRFMGLLPLVGFLTQQVLGAGGWRLPPLRASFVIDDPNLHWPSYGFIDYRELVAHATRHGYHVGFATVPLDGWLADRRVTALLARNASALSLSMHGNDHVARDLDRLSTDAQAQAAIAQALRRIAALERRSGVSVDRVMVPPHSACSEAALRAMFRLGVEAACSTKPHPWRYDLPAATALDGWHPAELVAGGIPVLPRYPFDAPREDLALQALLGHPLILYGHHGDFAQGLDFLAQAAGEIETLGDGVRWGPLSWIARGNFATRRLGETLLVRMHARRIAVEVPAGVRELRLLIDEPLGGAAGHRVTHAGGSVKVDFAGGVGITEPLTVDAPLAIDAPRADAPSKVELTLTADRPLSPAEAPARPVKPWPLLRRALAEGRDRAQALRG